MSHRSAKPRRKFEDMDQSELIYTRDDVQSQLNRVKAQIQQVCAGIKAQGRRPSITDYPKLESQRFNLDWILGKVNSELRKYDKPERPSRSSEAEKFQEVAKTLLEPGLYDHLLAQARELRN